MTHPSIDAELAPYAWADDAADDATDALTIALVRPLLDGTPAHVQVLAAYPKPMTLSEADDENARIEDFAWGSELLQTDDLDGWSVLIQPNGWGLSLPEVASKLSPSGDAISLFWNVNAVMSVTVARAGHVVRYFDPLLYDDGGTPLREEADLPFGVGHPRASALVVAERLTGVQIRREWLLGRSRRTFRVAIPRT